MISCSRTSGATSGLSTGCTVSDMFAPRIGGLTLPDNWRFGGRDDTLRFRQHSAVPPALPGPSLLATSSPHAAKFERRPVFRRKTPYNRERNNTGNERRKKIAVFCDFENVALGVRDSEIKKFDINLVLERLLEKGKIIVKKAYCDWERYSDYKRSVHEAAIELIDIPQKYYSGKNSADIKMVVDAMDICYSKEHLDTFALLSGDSDFSPLVSKLKENNKYVIGSESRTPLRSC